MNLYIELMPIAEMSLECSEIRSVTLTGRLIVSDEQIVYIPCLSGNNAFSECAVFYRPGRLLWLMGAGPGGVRMEFTETDALRLARTIMDMLGVVPEIPQEHLSVPTSQELQAGDSNPPISQESVAVPRHPVVAYCPYCGSVQVRNQTNVFSCEGCSAVFAVSFSQFLRGIG